MKNERPYWKVVVSLLINVLVMVLTVWIGIKAMVYFMPFVIGWFISFIANPLVLWLEKRVKIVKKLGSAIIIILVLGLIVLVSYLAISKLVEEISLLINNFPEIYQDLEDAMGQLGDRFAGVFSRLPQGIQNGLSTIAADLDAKAGDFIAGISQPTVTAAGNIAKRIPSILVATIVMLVSSYFFIAQRDEVIVWAKSVSPQGLQRHTTMIIDNLKQAVGGYFKAQFKIMGVVGVLLFIGFLILRVNYSVLLAILIAFLDFLPFFGTGTALIPWAVYELFGGNYFTVVGLLIIYVVTQAVRHIIQPKLVGDSVGMNPLATLVFLYAGYKFGSLLGMILAVPIGMLAINLYKAGAFDFILNDVKILIDGIQRLRGRIE
ncbi:MAG: sporulation integral membrane protein YtvI [Lachnospiraceae bacterium]